MPPLTQPRGWRYLKSRLRLLNRPQAWGTVAVLLVAGAVLSDYWRRQPIAAPAANTAPAASAPTLRPSDPLSTLAQPAVEPSAAASPSTSTPSIAPTVQPSPLDLLGSPAQPVPNSLPRLGTATTTLPNRTGSGSADGSDSFAPANPAVLPADPLGSAIAGQSNSRQPAAPTQPRSGSPYASTPYSSPYTTSPPPGTTGYTQPPSLAASPPTSGLPAPRPEVTGQSAAPSPYGGAPAPIAPPIEPQSLGQPIGGGNINTFGNP